MNRFPHTHVRRAPFCLSFLTDQCSFVFWLSFRLQTVWFVRMSGSVMCCHVILVLEIS
jgi:hypothetical protein